MWSGHGQMIDPPWRTSTYKRLFTLEGNYVVVICGDNYTFAVVLYINNHYDGSWPSYRSNHINIKWLPVGCLVVGLAMKCIAFLPTSFVLVGDVLGIVVSLVDSITGGVTASFSCVISIFFLSCQFICFKFANSFKIVTRLDCSTA